MKTADWLHPLPPL